MNETREGWSVEVLDYSWLYGVQDHETPLYCWVRRIGPNYEMVVRDSSTNISVVRSMFGSVLDAMVQAEVLFALEKPYYLCQ